MVNGAPHDGKFLPPGKPLLLSALVTNNGPLPATALVTILYAPMSAQFTTDLKGAVQFSDFWLAGETKRLAPVEWIVPAGLPSHVCLLAAVDSVLDPIPTPLPKSIADRRHAQCNLDFLTVSPGSDVSTLVSLGRGIWREHTMHAVLRADLSAGADDFARAHHLHLDPELARQVRPVLEMRTSLEWMERLRFNAREGHHETKLHVQMLKTARPVQAVALTVEQFAMAQEDDRPLLVGSLAVVLVVG